jgi:hypothetical protein
LVKHSKGRYSLVNVVVLFFYQHQTPAYLSSLML